MTKSKKNTSHKQNNKTKKCEVKKCEVYTKFEENFKSIPISGDNEINRIFKKAIAPTDLKPQDDYYSYINYKWLQNVKNAKGQEYIYQLDDFRFVQHKVFNELIHIIDEYTKNDKSVQAKEMLGRRILQQGELGVRYGTPMAFHHRDKFVAFRPLS